jgi:hypothetical protein
MTEKNNHTEKELPKGWTYEALKKIASYGSSLSPGESFHPGRFLQVPAGLPLIVEMTMHGKRTMWGKGFQWRASVASLPVSKKINNQIKCKAYKMWKY